MSERVGAVVAGAGVVGLAVARALARAGREVLVLEAADAIGTETSSRNSEVVHAGIYYPKGSLKALLCVRGRRLLYEYCQSHGVPVSRLGKLIVATSQNEARALDGIAAKAWANGVEDLRPISVEEALALEPALACTGALLSPSTGIVDSHRLMLAYQGDAEDAGAMVAFHAPILRGRPNGSGWSLEVGGAEPMRLDCDLLVNAAGLGAVALAGRLEGLAAGAIPPAYLCKGSYYGLAGRPPFRHLIYPVPEHAGLGVHLTLDLGGQARFGPDTEWVDRIDYAVDVARADGFYAAIRRYWPGLPDGALQPGYAGMRPKISGPHEPAADFRIDGPAQHGLAGLVNLFGIESPGLTASLAIADHVATLAREEYR
ncbi:MAG TPA: NAD(P)/FAD-dependent oxidoreductase [Aliidongia sp.]|uniref:NAD(P)/FAD-dependent oxidoreductase n=1 Tax=Aliidongia sp. TaxID=1914230 RepID=UPI002DDC8FE8|nr:NAD(P)/FAD-dependent oxidoreductase [Aliidongia sp.]HEV2678188.1 NAD(P)/FAD-dependent oxidoreductase [Aliidongia sp.]